MDQTVQSLINTVSNGIFVPLVVGIALLGVYAIICFANIIMCTVWLHRYPQPAVTKTIKDIAGNRGKRLDILINSTGFPPNKKRALLKVASFSGTSKTALVAVTKSEVAAIELKDGQAVSRARTASKLAIVFALCASVIKILGSFSAFTGNEYEQLALSAVCSVQALVLGAMVAILLYVASKLRSDRNLVMLSRFRAVMDAVFERVRNSKFRAPNRSLSNNPTAPMQPIKSREGMTDTISNILDSWHKELYQGNAIRKVYPVKGVADASVSAEDGSGALHGSGRLQCSGRLQGSGVLLRDDSLQRSGRLQDSGAFLWDAPSESSDSGLSHEHADLSGLDIWATDAAGIYNARSGIQPEGETVRNDTGQIQDDSPKWVQPLEKKPTEGVLRARGRHSRPLDQMKEGSFQESNRRILRAEHTDNAYIERRRNNTGNVGSTSSGANGGAGRSEGANASQTRQAQQAQIQSSPQTKVASQEPTEKRRAKNERDDIASLRLGAERAMRESMNLESGFRGSDFKNQPRKQTKDSSFAGAKVGPSAQRSSKPSTGSTVTTSAGGVGEFSTGSTVRVTVESSPIAPASSASDEAKIHISTGTRIQIPAEAKMQSTKEATDSTEANAPAGSISLDEILGALGVKS